MVHAWNRLTPAYEHLSGDEKLRAIPAMFGRVLEEVIKNLVFSKYLIPERLLFFPFCGRAAKNRKTLCFLRAS